MLDVKRMHSALSVATPHLSAGVMLVAARGLRQSVSSARNSCGGAVMKPLRLRLLTYSSTATALLGGMRLGALLLLGPVPKYISSAAA
jgi:hypothetical protein